MSQLIEGRARFVDAHTIGVNGSVQAKHLVIATGPSHIPSVPGRIRRKLLIWL